MTDRAQSRRILSIAVLIAAVWGLLLYRLIVLHNGEQSAVKTKLERIRSVQQTILTGRGRIFDRRGHLLASDVTKQHVNVDPLLLQSNGYSRFVASQLARVLELEPAVVMSQVSRPGRRQEFVKKFAMDEDVREIRAMGLDQHGVFFTPVSRREYPNGLLMSHVIGFSNMEGVGSAGLELQFDRYLRGVPGLRTTEVDGKRREVFVRRGAEILPQQGADLHLTLDRFVQDFCEKALDRCMEQHNPKAAWVVVQEVKTGRLLALANRPGYDPNHYNRSSREAHLNHAVEVAFEPGSTFKVATIAAALDAGVVQPDESFDCENGAWNHFGTTLRDYKGYGHLSVADILKKSSNIGAAKITERLGDKRLMRYLREFGFGVKSGIPLPGESAGLVMQPTSEFWSKLTPSQMAMGHGIGVTAIQLAGMISAMGNEGQLMRPLLVDRILDHKGNLLRRNEPEVVARPIRPETARLVCQMMTRVTETGGTAVKARIDGHTVCGKTGSAQKIIDQKYSDSAHIASFIGLLPAERPEIAIVVIVDEPQPVHLGGVVAAPVFSEIATRVAGHLDIRPVPAEYAWTYGDRIPEWEERRKE